MLAAGAGSRELAGGRVGIDPFLEAEQRDAALFEHRDRQRFAERAPEAVQIAAICKGVMLLIIRASASTTAHQTRSAA